MLTLANPFVVYSSTQAFEGLLDSHSLQQYVSCMPSRWLLVAEHAATALLAAGVITAAVSRPQAATAAAMAAWLLLQLRAWSTGHGSYLGRRQGVFLVHGRYGQPAGALRIAAAQLLDVGFAVATCGVGFAVGTVPAICLSAERQSLGQRLLRIAPVQETPRPLHIDKYWTPSTRSHKGL